MLLLAGRLGLAASAGLSAALSRLVESPNDRVIIDFNGVDYLSSAGIAVFHAVLRPARERGVTIAVCGLSEPVRLALELGGVLDLLVTADTRQAAVARLTQKN